MFACQQENVVPDFLCLAKGLTGGYLPLAATLTTEAIYRAFEGAEHVFYYGHSYTANPLGCAVALASLDVFEQEPVPLDHPLLTLPNVTVLPHIGSATIQTRLEMMALNAEAISACLESRSVKNRVC